MCRLILTQGRLVVVPDGKSHAECVRQGGPDGIRVRDHGDVIFVHLEALLDQDAREVEAAVRAALARLVDVGWYS